MRTLQCKLDVDLDATARDLEECTRDGVNKLADNQFQTLTLVAKMFMKQRVMNRETGGGGGGGGGGGEGGGKNMPKKEVV